MKLKYYLRGFGTGVLFATLVLMVAFQIDKSVQPLDKHKEKETTNKAAENEMESNSVDHDTMVSIVDETEESDAKESDSIEGEEGATSTQETSQEENSSEEETTKETEAPTTPPETEEITSAQETTASDNSTAILVITAGMNSITASALLEDLGVVEDGEDYNLYLHNNGYSSKLKIGTYEIKKGASYEEITAIIARVE